MSRLSEDIDALRAMAVSKMAPASIAKTLGRSVTWVERQLGLLPKAQSRDAAVFAIALGAICRLIRKISREAGGFAVFAARLTQERVDLDTAPAPEARQGVGLVERSFHTVGGRYGAAVPLADGRLAFVDTVRRIAVGAAVDVVSRDGAFVLIK